MGILKGILGIQGTIVSIVALLALTSSCREDEYVTFVTETDTGQQLVHQSTIAGLYVLNEGNMGSNKCTLDYLDLSSKSDSTAHYYRNIYASRNPSTVMELGDVGNDIGIYGTKLWMVINCSNKVEVCTTDSARRLGQIDLDNGRSLAFDGGYAYVSSYAGPVLIEENCPLGRVYKVDTLSLEKVDSLTVGYQPEEMAISNGRLYVANSGGYRVPNYDTRVSVIDLARFEVVDEIEVGINLHRMVADAYGQVWVSSRGDYFAEPARLFWLNVAGNTAQGSLELPVSAMTLVGDSLFFLGTSFSYTDGGYARTMGIVDVRTHSLVKTALFDAPEIAKMTLPYGIVVNPIDRDFYLMDAKNYVSSGELLHFTAEGTFDWKVQTGDIPSRGAFVYRNERMKK